MLNNGSKFFIGLTALTTVSFGVYMLLIHPSALGATALFGLVAATAFLATMVVFTRDGDTELSAEVGEVEDRDQQYGAAQGGVARGGLFRDLLHSSPRCARRGR